MTASQNHHKHDIFVAKMALLTNCKAQLPGEVTQGVSRKGLCIIKSCILCGPYCVPLCRIAWLRMSGETKVASVCTILIVAIGLFVALQWHESKLVIKEVTVCRLFLRR